eukprot:TRINITY_DN6812_c0_g1_i1.p1 TRINITY_DN6812_c0_g1~~TRINITY_DN6812_c0_g1_i1.p1  ORF type:complete len:209 (-),score=49.54 TRINITY_DN6812_c0_g1_i1:7-633(-)
MPECGGCERDLPAASYGKMQLKKGPGVMKCKDCVTRGADVVKKELADKAAVEQAKNQLQLELERGGAFLEANKLKDGVVCLPSGLQYRVLEKGSGKFHPNLSSRCECHYVGKLIDGTQFDSSIKGGVDGPRLIMPAVIAPEDVIAGWTEAMQLMVEGDKWELVLPPQLAYGEAGSPPKIPAGAVLLFELEMMKIKGGKVEKGEAAEKS